MANTQSAESTPQSDDSSVPTAGLPQAKMLSCPGPFFWTAIQDLPNFRAKGYTTIRQGFPKVASRLRWPVIARSVVCDEAISDSEGREIASPSQAQGRNDSSLGKLYTVRIPDLTGNACCSIIYVKIIYMR